MVHRDEFPDVRKDFEAVHPPKREPFRSAYTGVAADVLPELRAADTSWSALGMRRPTAPPAPPSRDLIEYQTAVSCAMHADYERHLDTLATLDGISAVLIEHPALLAYPSHPGVRLGLRRALAGLDEPLPGSDWAADLRAVLPVATPKTEVA
jgi:hypothetical protein